MLIIPKWINFYDGFNVVVFTFLKINHRNYIHMKSIKNWQTAKSNPCKIYFEKTSQNKCHNRSVADLIVLNKIFVSVRSKLVNTNYICPAQCINAVHN